MVEITGLEMFKKRWLYYLSFIFIYLVPGALIIYQTITIRTNDNDVSVNAVGLVLGIVYIAFVAKKVRAHIKSMKPGPMQILITWIGNIIPFATVGCLIMIVERSFGGFATLVWIICVSMLIGALMRAIEFMINRRFLYNLYIEEKAREKFDIEKKIKELEGELIEDE